MGLFDAPLIDATKLDTTITNNPTAYYVRLFNMAKISIIVWNYLLEMDGNITGDYGNGVTLSVMGSKMSHRSCATEHYQYQMRTAAVSKYIFGGQFSI